MSDLRELLIATAARAAEYREAASERPVFPDVDLAALRAELGSMREGPTPADAVIEELARVVEPALVASTGPRYFGFVIGGALDAATAADVLTTGWTRTPSTRSRRRPRRSWRTWLARG